VVIVRFDYPLQDAAKPKVDGVGVVTMLVYSALLTLALVLSSPWWLLRMATTQRYREGLRQRLGTVPKSLRTAVEGKRVVWIHAVSVGEVLAASRLVGELEAALGDGYRVVISTTTRTGQALARERFGAERVFYMPLDFGFSVRAYLRALRPVAVVLMESELWPRMLSECGRGGVPVVVANARMSDRSFARAMRVQWIWGRVMRKPALWLVQSEEDARRLVLAGVRAEAVQVAGNMKYDIRAPRQSRIAELIREAAGGRRILVGGSTIAGDPPEDSALIRAQQSIPQSERPLLVLAPRHPENFGVIYSMAIEFPTLLATELLAGKDASQGFSSRFQEHQTKQVEIVVLDTIGDLAAVYGIADVAFVGGSLIKKGGHNPLEPAQFGVPVVMGPSFENFRDVVVRMKEAEGIAIVGEAAGLSTAAQERAFGRDDRTLAVEELETVLVRLLTNREEARAMGERGRRVFEEQQGATARSVGAIVSLIAGEAA
jgi:3-deoxy-D-manno-octulosonic-acid transferase